YECVKLISAKVIVYGLTAEVRSSQQGILSQQSYGRFLMVLCPSTPERNSSSISSTKYTQLIPMTPK
ncbi:hypothetical protein NPIL_601581, partial [Nephila pilipes]